MPGNTSTLASRPAASTAAWMRRWRQARSARRLARRAAPVNARRTRAAESGAQTKTVAPRGARSEGTGRAEAAAGARSAASAAVVASGPVRTPSRIGGAEVDSAREAPPAAVDLEPHEGPAAALDAPARGEPVDEA